MDLALNNLQWLIYRKTKRNQTNQVLLCYTNNLTSVICLYTVLSCQCCSMDSVLER